jgi:hypothetical protein
LVFVRRASTLNYERGRSSGYSEHTGTSSRTAIFIGEIFADGEIPPDIITVFKYFAANDEAEELPSTRPDWFGDTRPMDD